MSEPWSEAPVTPQEAVSGSLPAPVSASPKTLLEQMQALLASVSENLAGLDADLQSSGTRADKDRGPADSSAGSSALGR